MKKIDKLKANLFMMLLKFTTKMAGKVCMQTQSILLSLMGSIYASPIAVYQLFLITTEHSVSMIENLERQSEDEKRRIH